MKKSILRWAVCAVFAFAAIQSYAVFGASQCDGTPWGKSNGRTCASMGLNSNKAVCRNGDDYAMFCDDTRTQIRVCASNQRCAGSGTAADSDQGECPKHIRKEHRSHPKCEAYEDGYRYGKRDVENDRRRDYERWDDKYDRDMEDYFEEGYKHGYRDFG